MILLGGTLPRKLILTGGLLLSASCSLLTRAGETPVAEEEIPSTTLPGSSESTETSPREKPEDPKIDSLRILPSDNRNCAACPTFDPQEDIYPVTLFTNVPVEFVVKGSHARHIFVDEARGADLIRPSAGLVDTAYFFKYRPPAEAGKKENVTIVSANADRTLTRKYIVEVTTKLSEEPRLASLAVSPGRLDPEFNTDVFAYNARVPEGTGCFNVELEGVDNVGTTCTVDNADSKPASIVGGGSAYVCFGPTSNVISISCVAADGNNKAQYVLTAVQQQGGSTLLSVLDVIGGTLNHEFNPMIHGVYYADLDLQRNYNQDFVGFIAKPKNPRGIVTVNKALVNPDTHFSPWFKVPKGTKKDFTIAVHTPENEIEEQYHVVVDRRGRWYERSRYANALANVIAWTSLFASSENSPTFLYNIRTLQFFSVTNKINGKPETYDAFSEGFGKWNLQPRSHSWIVSPKDENYTNIIHVPVTPYDENGMPTFTTTTTTTTAPPTTSSTEFLSSVVEPQMAAHIALEQHADGEWKPIVSADELQTAFAKESSTNRRRLVALDPDSQLRIALAVNAEYKQRIALMEYMGSIVVITVLLILVGIAYGIALHVFIRRGIRSRDGQVRDTPRILYPMRFWTFVFDIVLIGYSQAAFGILAAPAELRSTRFILFKCIPCTPKAMMWLAIVVLIQFPVVYLCLVGWVLRSLHNSVVYSRELGFYHRRTTLVAKAEWKICRWLPFIANLLSVEIRDVAPIRAVDTSEGGKLRYVVDESAAQGNGSETQTQLSFHREERSGGPCNLRLPEFGAEAPNGGYASEAEAAMLPHKDRSMPGRELDLPARPRGVHFHPDARQELKVSLAEIHRSHMHDTSNAGVYSKYPEAVVGRRAVQFLNPYGETVDCHAELQLRHLSNVWQMGELGHQLAFWIPTHNCQLLDFDGWFNYFHLSHRGMYYYYLADRVVAIAAVLLVVLWGEPDGVTTTILLACGTLLLGAIYTPAAISSGTAAWYRHMENELRREIKMRRLLEKEKQRQARWPFSTSYELEEQVLQLQRKREAADMCGSGGFFTRHPDCGISDLPFWDTRFCFVLKYILTGAPGNEFFKCLVITSVALGSPAASGALSNGFSSTLAFFFACLSLICLNYESMQRLLQTQVPEFVLALRRGFRRLCVWTVETFGDTSHFGGRMKHTFKTLWARLQGESYPSFDFPGMAGHRVREQRVSEAFLVFEEVGLHMKGALHCSADAALKKRIIGSHEQMMFGGKLSKTLYQAGPLGVNRVAALDEVMPIRLPFRSLYHGKMAEPLPVAATVHVVNHGFRSILKDPSLKNAFGPEDDSYLTLFRDPRFLPEWGVIEPPTDGHGYSVFYDGTCQSLTIKGPSIRAREEYNVYSIERRSGDGAETPSDETPIDGAGSQHTVTAVCASSGSLYISVPSGKPPCLMRPIHVETPTGETFVIDPLDTKVHYEPVCQELVLRHAKLLARHDAVSVTAIMSPPAATLNLNSNQPSYSVTWTVAGAGQQFDETVICQDDGVVHIKLREEGPPGLDRSMIVIRCERDGTKITVNPQDSDTHRLAFPVAPTPSGIPFWKIKAWWSSALRGVISSDDDQRDRVEDSVPCTVVQCVNPALGLYRVEPNFREVMKALRAQLHHLNAQRAQLSQPWCLSTAWQLVMSPARLWKFWKEHGVDIVPAQGLWVNPLVDVSEPLIRRQQKRIEQVTPLFRKTVEDLFAAQAEELEFRLRYVAEWIRAYDDPALYAAQLAKDAAEQRGAPDLERYSEAVRSIRKQYESKIGSAFVYPLIVPEHRLSLRPNLGAQVRQWKQQLAVWLRAEEDAPLFAPLRGAAEPTSLEKVVMEVMHAVKSNVNAAEEPTIGRPLTALHYVMDSLSVRGPFTNWRPDPIGGHLAAVRLWPRGPDGEPDFTADPVWNPCCLKLSASAVKILLPAKDDAEYDFGNAYYWSHVLGYSVQLDCLDTLNVTTESSLPQGAASNALLDGQRGQLTCWLTAELPHVGDRHIRLVENGKPNREVNINPNAAAANTARTSSNEGNPSNQELTKQADNGVLLVSLGKRVTDREAGYLPRNEVRIASNGTAQAYPLTFRFSDRFVPKWAGVIEAAQMDRPPLEVDDQFGLDQPSTDRETTVQPSETPSPPPVPESLPSISSEPSLHTPEPVDPRPPASMTEEEARVQYAGGWKNYRYHGVGTLRDAEGKEIYSGEWREGRRWGRGRCSFRDATTGALWNYEGEFKNDDFCGRGKATLVDQEQLSRLQRTQDPEKLRNTIVSFIGEFRQPRSNKRRYSNCYTEKPRLPPAALAQLFEQDPEQSQGPIIIDIRRTVSLNIGDLESADGSNDSATSMKSILEAAKENYLPHKTAWLSREPHVPSEPLAARFAAGIAHFADGSVYQGQFNDRNQPHGKGRLMSADGTFRLEGEFKNGVPDGYVAVTAEAHKGAGEAPAEISYFGQMRNGKRDGEGIMSSDAFYLETVFENDGFSPEAPLRIHKVRGGLGTSDNTEDVDSFSGPLKNGLPTGPDCTVRWSDGAEYVGGMRDGLRCGKGVMKDSRGRVVVSAQWENDVPHGRAARLVQPDGKVYSGEMCRGKRHGLGELYHSEKGEPFFEGMWTDDVPHGRGTLYAPDGQYEGEYRRGCRHGKGCFEFAKNPLPNGAPRMYTGDWRNDQPHGVGMYRNELGVENTYKFENGQLDKASLKAYKNGMCGSVPTLGVAPSVKVMGFQSVSSPWFGSHKSLMAHKVFNDEIRAMSSLLSYKEQMNATRSFVPLERAPQEPRRPCTTPPQRPQIGGPGSTRPVDGTTTSPSSSGPLDFQTDSPIRQRLLQVRILDLKSPRVKSAAVSFRATVGKNSASAGPHSVSVPWVPVESLLFPLRKDDVVRVELIEPRDRHTIAVATADLGQFLSQNRRESPAFPVQLSEASTGDDAGTLTLGYRIVERGEAEGNAGGGLMPLTEKYESGQSSESGGCVVPKERSPIRPPYVYVYVEKATGLPSMDAMHDMDPYVIIKVGEQKRQSKVQKRAGTDPKFKEEFFIPLDEEERVVFEIYDKDVLKSDDFVSRGELPLPVDNFDGHIQVSTMQCMLCFMPIRSFLQLYRAEKKKGSVKAGLLYVKVGSMSK